MVEMNVRTSKYAFCVVVVSITKASQKVSLSFNFRFRLDKSELVIDEEKKCPPGKVYDPCVIECDNLCSIYGYIIKQKQLCPNNTQCQPGCVTPGQKVTCSSDMKRLNDHTCVKEEDCICSTPNGIAIKVSSI